MEEAGIAYLAMLRLAAAKPQVTITGERRLEDAVALGADPDQAAFSEPLAGGRPAC